MQSCAHKGKQGFQKTGLASTLTFSAAVTSWWNQCGSMVTARDRATITNHPRPHLNHSTPSQQHITMTLVQAPASSATHQAGMIVSEEIAQSATPW
jgi:hypothetical protein